MDISQFHSEICKRIKQKKDRDLKSFLLALCSVLKNYKSKAVSFDTILEVIDYALVGNPIPMNDDWLDITEEPTQNRMTRKFTNAGLENMQNKNIDIDSKDIEFTYKVLRFQAAEMHEMEGHELDDPNRFFGISSPLGYDWYNFTALTVIEAGIRCTIDNDDDVTSLDWGFIGRVLEDGRVYE